jgi:hypothetical protein
MKDERFTKARRARTRGPGGIGCFFSAALSMILIFGVIGLSLIAVGDSSTVSVGIILGVPLILIALVIPFVMAGRYLSSNEINGPCPYCGAALKTTDSIAALVCPSCQKEVLIKGMKFFQAE